MRGKTELLFWKDFGYFEACILLTKRKNGSFTLKGQKGGCGGIEYCFCSRPFRDGKALLINMHLAAGEVYEEPLSFNWNEVVANVEALDPPLSQQVRELLPSLESILADEEASDKEWQARLAWRPPRIA